MTDQSAASAQYVINADGNKGAVIGAIESISGGNNIFGQVIYTAQDVALVATKLPRIDPNNNFFTPPSSINELIAKLNDQRLLILYAPVHYGVDYVADYLAQQLRRERIYRYDSDAPGSKLRGIFENKEREADLKNSVILVPSVRPEQYVDVWMDIARLAASPILNVRVILTTSTEVGWRAQNTPAFVSLDNYPAYTPADLSAWLIKGLDDARGRLESIGVLQAQDKLLSSSTQLSGLDMTIEALAARLKGPAPTANFVARLRTLTATDRRERVRSFLEDIEAAQSSQVQAWFNGLEYKEERYFVLALALLDSLDWTEGVEQGTFWAIYERLTQEAWRERDTQLSMADYLNLAQKLSTFINVENNRIRFRNRDDQRTIIAQALKTHRRALVQALPMLAGILTAEARPTTAQSDNLARGLNSLDIVGSDLYTSENLSSRQNALRDNIALSIARIGKLEPSTTEYLLLSWAEGLADSASEEANIRLRLAVSRTLVQIMRLETADFDTDPGTDGANQTQSWSATRLLSDWYQRFRNGSAGSTYIAPSRRANIRSTMSIALAHLGRAYQDSPTYFGIEQAGINKSQAVDLAIPSNTGQPEIPSTLWNMLISLAWDPDPAVRASAVYGVPELLESYPDQAERLLELMASDWNVNVRVNVARLLVALIERDPWRSYLLHRLLTMPDVDSGRTEPIRHLDGRSDHYLYIEWLAYQRSSLPALKTAGLLHLWTATYALLYASVRNPALLHSYLGQLIATPDPDGLQALRSVLYVVALTQPSSNEFRARILKPILITRKKDGQLSDAAEQLKQLMREWLKTLPFTETINYSLERKARLLLWKPPVITVNYARSEGDDRRTLDSLIRTALAPAGDRRHPMGEVIEFFQIDPETKPIIDDLLNEYVVQAYKDKRKELEDAADREMEYRNQNHGPWHNISVNFFGRKNLKDDTDPQPIAINDLLNRANNLR
ncbi:MAG: hypothetical protein KF716_19020 [Anaerolineae bacterium]|nr:hypothetical protein [Anaerolineae bacterium]